MRIDAHQHFWIYDSVRDVWIDNEMQILKKNFLPEDFLPVLKENNIEGCVTVQADQSLAETSFLLKLADENNFVKGVVGWVDLRTDNLEAQLEKLSSFNKLKGFRHIVQAEGQEDFLLRDDFCKGISLLEKYGFTYDILIYPKQLKSAIQFVKRFPDQFFVVDHLAKPNIREGKIEEWKNEIKMIAEFANVYCKLSGMVTEADWKNWSIAEFKPYIETILENFGIDRVMFGSDWPVCSLAATYQECCEIIEKNTIHFSENEKRKFWGENAIRFYNL